MPIAPKGSRVRNYATLAVALFMVKMSFTALNRALQKRGSIIKSIRVGELAFEHTVFSASIVFLDETKVL